MPTGNVKFEKCLVTAPTCLLVKIFRRRFFSAVSNGGKDNLVISKARFPVFFGWCEKKETSKASVCPLRFAMVYPKAY